MKTLLGDLGGVVGLTLVGVTSLAIVVVGVAVRARRRSDDDRVCDATADGGWRREEIKPEDLLP